MGFFRRLVQQITWTALIVLESKTKCLHSSSSHILFFCEQFSESILRKSMLCFLEIGLKKSASKGVADSWSAGNSGIIWRSCLCSILCSRVRAIEVSRHPFQCSAVVAEFSVTLFALDSLRSSTGMPRAPSIDVLCHQDIRALKAFMRDDRNYGWTRVGHVVSALQDMGILCCHDSVLRECMHGRNAQFKWETCNNWIRATRRFHRWTMFALPDSCLNYSGASFPEFLWADSSLNPGASLADFVWHWIKCIWLDRNLAWDLYNAWKDAGIILNRYRKPHIRVFAIPGHCEHAFLACHPAAVLIDARVVDGRNNGSGERIETITGLHPCILSHVMSQEITIRLVLQAVVSLSLSPQSVLGFVCDHGKHRSVAMAVVLCMLLGESCRVGFSHPQVVQDAHDRNYASWQWH